MTRQEVVIRITLEAPFLFPGLVAGRQGFDLVAQRDHTGAPIIPGTQLRGVLRHALAAMGRPVVALFGGEPEPEPAPEAKPSPPGMIFFSDLRAVGGATPVDPYHRVRIDAETGTAEEGHLLTIEQLAPPGGRLSFEGRCAAFYDGDLAGTIEAALAVPLSIGAMRTIGFGRIVEREVRILPPAEAADATIPAGPFIWLVELDRPYLVDATRVADNAYRGAVAIPGGAIKGALARALHLGGHATDTGPLADALAKLHVRHTLVQEPRPLSEVRSESKDIDLRLDPVPSEGELKHQSDYKDGPTFAVDYEERVHVRISPETGMVVDGMLYATRAVVPPALEDAFRDGIPVALDASGIGSEERRVLGEALVAGIPGLGRTDATLLHRSFVEDSRQPPIPETIGNRVTLMLRTPALLAEPTGARTMLEDYSLVWANILPKAELLRCWTAQDLAGGYLATRYRRRGTYRPYVLTRAGSVFELDVGGVDRKALETILARGVCRSTLDDVTMTWANCPWVVENGYGALSILEDSP
jgi:hypothetical protein